MLTFGSIFVKLCRKYVWRPCCKGAPCSQWFPCRLLRPYQPMSHLRHPQLQVVRVGKKRPISGVELRDKLLNKKKGGKKTNRHGKAERCAATILVHGTLDMTTQVLPLSAHMPRRVPPLVHLQLLLLAVATYHLEIGVILEDRLPCPLNAGEASVRVVEAAVLKAQHLLGRRPHQEKQGVPE